MTCFYCDLPAVDPVWPWGSGDEACRSCFAQADSEAEAAEMTLLPTEQWVAMLPQPVTPQYRRTEAPSMLGRRFGRMTVAGIAWRRRSDGRATRCWRLRCDCGETSLIPTCDLERKNRQACRRCAARAVGFASAKRHGGLTPSEIAARAGVPVQTVRRRISRGWPLERLAQPKHRRAA